MKEASPEIVALYRYVANAGRPVPFDELVESALPPQMRSDAMRAYTFARAQDGWDTPDEYWSEKNKDAAWRWWVGELVEVCRHTKRFSVTTADGGPTNTKGRDSKLYEARTPPMVKYADGKVRQWTPEHDREYQRAVAGQRVVQRAEDAIRRLTSLDRKDREFVTAVIRDALDAVKV